MKKKEPKDLLIIPDCHAAPEYDNKRFSALGNFIIEQQPEGETTDE